MSVVAACVRHRLIVEGESNNSLGWFIACIRARKIMERPDLCVISDQHKGIITGMNNECPGTTHHRFYVNDFASNFYFQVNNL